MSVEKLDYLGFQIDVGDTCVIANEKSFLKGVVLRFTAQYVILKVLYKDKDGNFIPADWEKRVIPSRLIVLEKAST